MIPSAFGSFFVTIWKSGSPSVFPSWHYESNGKSGDICWKLLRWSRWHRPCRAHCRVRLGGRRELLDSEELMGHWLGHRGLLLPVKGHFATLRWVCRQCDGLVPDQGVLGPISLPIPSRPTAAAATTTSSHPTATTTAISIPKWVWGLLLLPERWDMLLPVRVLWLLPHLRLLWIWECCVLQRNWVLLPQRLPYLWHRGRALPQGKQTSAP